MIKFQSVHYAYIHRAVYRNSAAQDYAEDHYEESVVMGPVDVKSDEQPVVVPWPQPESKKRPKHKF